MPRPSIDLHQKVRDLLRHADALPAELSSPIVNYERTVDGYLALLKYVDDHLRTSRIKEDLRYVKRFLFETARHANGRIGRRLAELLTEIHQADSKLFDAQSEAHAISQQFRFALTIHGRVGSP